MFPCAISIGTYDRLLKLPYVYYGPELKGVRFRGRPLQEWAVLIIALPILWPVVDVVIMAGVATHLTARMFEGVGWGVAHIFATWFLSSSIAGVVYRKFINVDRDLGWILQTVRSESVRVARAYGPLDTAAVWATAPLFAAATWALTAATELPLPVELFVAAAATWPFGCWAVSVWQPPERAQRLATDRAYRRGPGAHLRLTGSSYRAEAA